MRNAILGLIALAVGTFLFTSWKIKSDVSEGVDMAVMMMSPYAVVTYDGVSVTLTGEVTVDGVQVRVKGFTDDFYIDAIGIDTPSFLSLMKLSDPQSIALSGGDGLPKYFGVIVEGFRMPVDADYALQDARRPPRGGRRRKTRRSACQRMHGQVRSFAGGAARHGI